MFWKCACDRFIPAIVNRLSYDTHKKTTMVVTIYIIYNNSNNNYFLKIINQIGLVSIYFYFFVFHFENLFVH